MTLLRKDVFKLAVPILVEQLFVMSLGMVNTMMAGHISKEAVSAIGMVDSINNIFIAFFTALAVGGTVVVAQYVGQKNVKHANDAMKQALYSTVIISLFITILMWVFRDSVISILFGSADKTVISNAYTYLEITLLTYPLISISLMANGILRGSGDTKTPMKISIFMNFLNVILGYLFIYGIDIQNSHFHMNVPSLGVKGAAIGIAIARITGAIAIIIILMRGTRLLKLKNIYNFKFNSELLKPIFCVGIPASIESLLFNGGKLITQIFIVDMGTASIASNTITNSIANMLNIPGNSLSLVATALIGQYMGRRNTEEAEKCLSYIIKASTVFLAVLAFASVPLAGFIVSLYTQNTEIIDISVKLLKLNAIFSPLWAISFVLPAGLKGAGDAKYTMITSIIGMWLFRIIAGYILGIPLGLGVIGIWLGMYIDWIVRGILYLLRFNSGKWKEFVLIKIESPKKVAQLKV